MEERKFLNALVFGELSLREVLRGFTEPLLPLIQEWKKRFPDFSILVTATSATGLERVASVASATRLLPFDHRCFISLALRGRLPTHLIVSETELWPALVSYLSAKAVPIFVVNGRLSSRSVKRYKLVGEIVRRTLKSVTKFCVIHERAKERFIALGAPEKRVVVTGNTKYDLQEEIDPLYDKQGAKKVRLGTDSPVVVLGSLRPGEEDIWIPALVSARTENLDLYVVIAPRHQEKFQYFAEALNKNSITFARRSLPQESDAAVRVLLLDSLGELRSMYQVAEGAFIGGTLLPQYGGHNPLEAAEYGCALALGPFGESINEIRNELSQQEAFVEIRSVHDAFEFLKRCSAREPHVLGYGIRAKIVSASHRGATMRTIEEILTV